MARSAAATTAGVLLLTPFALATWRVDGAALAWAAGSACAEIAYFVLLGRAYRGAPVSRTYPIARGLAPVLVLLATVVVTRSVLPLEVLAVGLVVAGVLLVAGAGGRPDAAVVGLAAPVSVGIATYTVLDSYGVQHASPAAYLWVAMTPVAVGLCFLSAADRTSTGRLRAEMRTPMSWVTGAGIMVAYGLV